MRALGIFDPSWSTRTAPSSLYDGRALTLPPPPTVSHFLVAVVVVVDVVAVVAKVFFFKKNQPVNR